MLLQQPSYTQGAYIPLVVPLDPAAYLTRLELRWSRMQNYGSFFLFLKESLIAFILSRIWRWTAAPGSLRWPHELVSAQDYYSCLCLGWSCCFLSVCDCRGFGGATVGGIAAEGLIVLFSCPCFSGGQRSGSGWWGRFCCPFSCLMPQGAVGTCGGSVIVTASA